MTVTGCSNNGDVTDATPAALEIRSVAAAATVDAAPTLLPADTDARQQALADLDLGDSTDVLAAGDRFAQADCGTDGIFGTDAAAVCSDDVNEVFLLGPVIADSSHLADASVSGADPSQVQVQFDEEGTAALADASAVAVSLPPERNRIAIVVNGVVSAAPQVVAPITSGDVELIGLTEQEAQELVDSLSD